MGDGIQRQRIGDCVYELDAQGLAAVAAAVEERDRQWREHIESGRPLIFNHRGAVAPAVTTSAGVTPAEVEDENLD